MPKKRYFNRENKTRLYRTWANMKSRCSGAHASRKDWKHYGGKGIQVCNAWHDFVIFAQWAAATGYADDLEIDRIDSNKNYCPANCRWATRQQQVINSAPRTKRVIAPYKGVHQFQSGTRWGAYIRVNGKTIRLGGFATAEQAARRYDRAARKYYGPFARPNFPA